jgi:hypothetical protein
MTQAPSTNNLGIEKTNIVSGKRPCKSRNLEETYWHNLCFSNSEVWLLQSHVWKRCWNGTNGYIMIHDRLRRGFIILWINSNNLEIDLAFAFVDSKHRRKHVVTNMFEVIKRKYPGRIVSLEAREEALPVWKKLGFQEYDGQTHFLWYQIP